MADYKLPICWLGKSQTVIGLNGERSEQIITEDQVNLACECQNEITAFWCPEGHMLECHVGMRCEEAQCSHYEGDMQFERNIDPDDGEEVETFDEDDEP